MNYVITRNATLTLNGFRINTHGNIVVDPKSNNLQHIMKHFTENTRLPSSK